MLSEAATLIDPGALVIVLAGTLLATTARSGWRTPFAALRMAGQLASPGFDSGPNRAALARAATAIHQRGTLCAETAIPPDPAIARLVEAVVASGTTGSLGTVARADRSEREMARFSAQRVFEHAGEVAPVFGLVGTLFAFTQLVPDTTASASAATMAAVSTAVLSSLYGVLSAHLAWFPLAQAIARRGDAEEEARAALAAWFAEELDGSHAHSPLTLRPARAGAAG